MVHSDFSAKTPITQVGPIADLAITNPHNVSQAAPRHIRKRNRFAAAGQHHMRPAFFVGSMEDPLGLAKTLSTQRGIEGIDLIFGD